MNITWDSIYLAIQIVVSVQLLLGILLNILEFKIRNLLLAYSCFIVIYTYNIFFSYGLQSAFLNKSLHLFGSYIYFGPILYLYLKSLLIEGATNLKDVIKHYSFPFTICIVYNIFEFDYYNFLVYGFLIAYLFLSFRIYKQIKVTLSGTLKKRFLWFIGITFIYLALDTPMLIIEDLVLLNFEPAVIFFPTVNNFFYTYLHFPLLFFHFFILSLYAITEIPRFKKYFLTKRLKESGISRDQMNRLKSEFETFFQQDKIYLDNNLSLDVLCKKVGLEKSLVSKFIKETYNKSFNDFVNLYRVEEFKRILSKEKYENYDLVGLANESGFRSKATFYRVFKEIEGITPNEYKKSLLKEH